MKLTETTIRNLIEKGASRWTKGDHDRLYLNGAAKEIVGLETTHYKSGSISSATLKGESISNSRAGKISDIICSAYIDLTTGKLYGRVRGESMDLLRAALEDLIESEKAQGGTPELDSTETTEPSTTTTVQDSTEEIKEDIMKNSIKETMKEEALTKDEVTCYPVGDLYLTTGDMHAILHVYHEVNRLYAKFDQLIEKRGAEKDPDPRMVAYHEELKVLCEKQAVLEGMANGISMVISKNGPYGDWDDVRVPIMDLCHSRNRGHKPELIEQINDFLFEA